MDLFTLTIKTNKQTKNAVFTLETTTSDSQKAHNSNFAAWINSVYL